MMKGQNSHIKESAKISSNLPPPKFLFPLYEFLVVVLVGKTFKNPFLRQHYATHTASGGSQTEQEWAPKLCW